MQIAPNVGQLDIERMFHSIANRLRALESNDTGWITATLQNSWTHFDASAPVQYRRKDGVTYFRGLANGAAATGSTVLTLPAGFRGGWLRGNSHWVILGNDTTVLVRTWNTGEVATYTVPVPWADLGSISFIAER